MGGAVLPELTGPFDGTAVLGEGLAGTVGVPVGPADRLVCAQLVAESALAARHLGEVDAAMALAAASVPYAAGWATIPGLGARTIAVVLGELGDVRRFPTAAPLVAYAGLDFTSAQSGAVAAKGRPSRRGRAVARRYLWLAVLRLGRGAFASVRERQRARGMPPGKAAVANMRRLLRVLFAMAKDGTVFRAAAGG